MLLLLFENIPLLTELIPSWDGGFYKHVAPDGAKKLYFRADQDANSGVSNGNQNRKTSHE